MAIKVKWICLLFIIGHCQISYTQNRSNTADFGNTANNQQAEEEVIKPKAYVKTFTLDSILADHTFADTSLIGFETFARHLQFDNAAVNLGNYGSAHREIFHKTNRDIYTDIGFHQYDLNKLKLENLKYYRINRAFNDLYFSPLSGQQNFEVKADFSRNFANNVNFSIDYERIKQEGFYGNQDTKMTRLGMGMWKSNPEKKHDLFISFLANNFNEIHNGGIDTTSYDLNGFLNGTSIRNPRNTAPTILSSEGVTRHQQFTFSVDNFWSTPNEKLKLHQHIDYETGFYRFGSEGIEDANDSLVYKSYITDSRGIRSKIGFSRLTNQFDIGLQVNNLLLKVGLTYKLLHTNNTLDSDTRHDLGITGNLKYSIGKVSFLNANANLGVGENSGNFGINGDLKIIPLQSIQINLLGDILRYDPSVIEQSFVSTESYVYQNDFGKVNAVLLGGKLKLSTIGVSFEAYTGLIDNAIYQDDLSLPQQYEGSVEYFQAKVKQHFFWRFIGIENAAFYQSFTDNIYNLPDVYSQHNIYLQSRVFKKRLLAKIGVLFYNLRYDGGLAFQPVTGAFYPSSIENDFHPYSEIYGVFKVDAFRIFFKYNNATDAFQPQVHYQINNYPQYDARFRMGVRWIISD